MGLRPLLVCTVSALCLATTRVDAVLVDFEGFANGQEVGSGAHGTAGVGGVLEPYPALFTLTGNSLGRPVQGAAIFDSTPGGSNSPGSDPDLLVGLGGILILQNDSFDTQTTPGIYDTANDEAAGGTLVFDFVDPVELLSIDLIDIDANAAVDLILTDASGLARTYSVPSFWTFDISVAGRDGFDTLDLTTLAPQLGEGGGIATAVEDAGFNPFDVDSLTVIHTGSAGIDNLSVIPAPSTLLVLTVGLAGMRRRSRPAA